MVISMTSEQFVSCHFQTLLRVYITTMFISKEVYSDLIYDTEFNRDTVSNPYLKPSLICNTIQRKLTRTFQNSQRISVQTANENERKRV